MKLYELLNATKYYQRFAVYVTNCYDQNIPIGRGVSKELLNQDENEELFGHIGDEIELITVAPGDTLIVLVRDKNYERNASELYSENYVKHWDNADASTRPWLTRCELEDFGFADNRRKTGEAAYNGATEVKCNRYYWYKCGQCRRYFYTKRRVVVPGDGYNYCPICGCGLIWDRECEQRQFFGDADKTDDGENGDGTESAGENDIEE